MLHLEPLSLAIPLLTGFLGGCLAGAVVLRRSPDPEHQTDEILRSRMFVLVDDEDHQRALLRVINRDSMLLLSDPEMRWHLRIRVGDEGPFIYLSEGEINHRIGLGVMREGNAGLELVARDGTPRVLLRLSEADEAALILNDGQGTQRVKLAVSSDGQLSFTLIDQNGKEIRPSSRES